MNGVPRLLTIAMAGRGNRAYCQLVPFTILVEDHTTLKSNLLLIIISLKSLGDWTQYLLTLFKRIFLAFPLCTRFKRKTRSNLRKPETHESSHNSLICLALFVHIITFLNMFSPYQESNEFVSFWQCTPCADSRGEKDGM